MDILESLKLDVERKRESVKRNKASYKKAKDETQKIIRKRILKAARTKLEKAEKAYKAAMPKNAFQEKIEKSADSVKATCKKIPFKRAISWTGLAVTTVVTAIAGFLIYDQLNQDSETPAKDSV